MPWRDRHPNFSLADQTDTSVLPLQTMWFVSMQPSSGRECCIGVPEVDAASQFEATHMASPVGCHRCPICLPCHTLLAPTLGKASGLLFPLPPSDRPRQTSARGGLPPSLETWMCYSWPADYFLMKNGCNTIVCQKINFQKQQLIFLLETPTPSQMLGVFPFFFFF